MSSRATGGERPVPEGCGNGGQGGAGWGILPAWHMPGVVFGSWLGGAGCRGVRARVSRLRTVSPRGARGSLPPPPASASRSDRVRVPLGVRAAQQFAAELDHLLRVVLGPLGPLGDVRGRQPVEPAGIGELRGGHRLELDRPVGRGAEREGQLRGPGQQRAGVVYRLQVEEVLGVGGRLRGLEEQRRGAKPRLVPTRRGLRHDFSSSYGGRPVLVGGPPSIVP
jgi:hypothetical protein